MYDKEKLYALIDEYWADYIKKQDVKDKESKNIVVEDSIPIVWFGDIDRYFESKCRVVTVGINPSNQEFFDTAGNWVCRFGKDAERLAHKPELNSNDKTVLVESYTRYFDNNPHDGWFNAYESILNNLPAGIRATYYGKNDYHRAIHIDYQTALATTKLWSLLMKENQIIVKEKIVNNEIFFNFLDFLNPKIVLFSASDTVLTDFLKKGYLGKYNELVPVPHQGNCVLGYNIDGRLLLYGTNSKRGPMMLIDSETRKQRFEEIYDAYEKCTS